MNSSPAANPSGHRTPRGVRRSWRGREAALRRGRRRPSGRSAARLPGVLVQLAAADRAARDGGLPGRRARPARLQPVVAAEGRRRLRRRQGGRRHPRPDPRARRRVGAAGGPRLGRHRRLGDRDGPPGGRGPPGDPQRGPSAESQRRAEAPQPAPEALVLLLLPAPGCPSAPCAPGTGGSSGATSATPGRRTRRRRTERYVESWSQPARATAIINYYRAAVRQSKQAQAELRRSRRPRWSSGGSATATSGPNLAEPSREDVPGLDRVERLDKASHWVHHDERSASHSCSATSSPPTPVVLVTELRTARRLAWARRVARALHPRRRPWHSCSSRRSC